MLFEVYFKQKQFPRFLGWFNGFILCFHRPVYSSDLWLRCIVLDLMTNTFSMLVHQNNTIYNLLVLFLAHFSSWGRHKPPFWKDSVGKNSTSRLEFLSFASQNLDTPGHHFLFFPLLFFHCCFLPSIRDRIGTFPVYSFFSSRIKSDFLINVNHLGQGATAGRV